MVRVSLFPACVLRGLLAELCSRGVLCFFSLFVRNRVVLFCGLVAERQHNPPPPSCRRLNASGCSLGLRLLPLLYGYRDCGERWGEYETVVGV